MEEVFQRLLDAYAVYYDVRKEDVPEPFDAEAVFSTKHEQYFLMKSAKLAEIQANEYVYFAKRGDVSLKELKALDESAWTLGTKRVSPNPDHKSSDIILIVVTDHLRNEIRENIRTMKHSKSYKLGFWGFSNYKLAVIESSTGDAAYNGQGRALKDMVRSLFAPENKSMQQ